MTTTIAPTTLSRLSLGRVIHSEWIKLRSLRSTIWSYAIIVLVSLGMAFVLSSALSNPDFGPILDSPEHTLIQASTFGLSFGVLVVAVLGVLVISGEYSTGMARSTLTAVPKRLPALAAKAIVLFVATYVVGLVATLGSAVVALVVLNGNGLQPAITGDVISSILLACLYLSLVALFALGIGTMLRSSAGGIAAALGLLLLLPTVLMVFASITQAQWAIDLIPYLLTNAGESMFLGGELELWQSSLAVVLWAAVPLAGGAVLLKRRDA